MPFKNRSVPCSSSSFDFITQLIRARDYVTTLRTLSVIVELTAERQALITFEKSDSS